MTKKDGDKIREFQREMTAIRDGYSIGSQTWEALHELTVGCELALRGVYFEVNRGAKSYAQRAAEAATA